MKFLFITLMLLLSFTTKAQTYRCVEFGQVTYSNQPCTPDQKSQLTAEKEMTAAQIQAEFEREVAERKEEERLDKIKHEEDEQRYAREREQLLSDQANVPQVRSGSPISETNAAEKRSTDWGFIVFLIALYFLPTIVANGREHHNSGAITILNLLLGWTILGWIIALVWAATAVRPKTIEPRSQNT